jgi:uncharacterized repeat protein (TIGR01451 family)
VKVQYDGVSAESEPLILFDSVKLEDYERSLTRAEVRAYNDLVLKRYFERPGLPGPPGRLGVFCDIFNLLVFLVTEYDYSPRVGDVIKIDTYKYTAPDVEPPAWLVRQTVVRDGQVSYHHNAWTEYEGNYHNVIWGEGYAMRHGLSVELASPALLYVTAPDGSHAGYNPSTGELVFDFPIAISDPGDEPFRLFIPYPAEGEYLLTAVGTESGSYTLSIQALNSNGIGGQELSFISSITEGESHTYCIMVPETGDITAWVVDVISPEISVEKTAFTTSGAPSSNVTFTITVSNTGDCTLDPVRVVDTLSAWMSYVSSSPAADTHDGTIIWNNVGPLDPGDSKTITLVARIASDASGSVTNAVTVTGTSPTGEEVTDSGTVTVISAEEATGIIIEHLEVYSVPPEAPKGVSQKIESAIDTSNRLLRTRKVLRCNR